MVKVKGLKQKGKGIKTFYFLPFTSKTRSPSTEAP